VAVDAQVRVMLHCVESAIVHFRIWLSRSLLAVPAGEETIQCILLVSRLITGWGTEGSSSRHIVHHNRTQHAWIEYYYY